MQRLVATVTHQFRERMFENRTAAGVLGELQTLMDIYFGVAADPQPVNRARLVLWAEALANPSSESRPLMVAADREFREAIEERLLAGITAGEIPASVDAYGLATVIVAMLRGVVLLSTYALRPGWRTLWCTPFAVACGIDASLTCSELGWKARPRHSWAQTRVIHRLRRVAELEGRAPSLPTWPATCWANPSGWVMVQGRAPARPQLWELTTPEGQVVKTGAVYMAIPYPRLGTGWPTARSIGRSDSESE